MTYKKSHRWIYTHQRNDLFYLFPLFLSFVSFYSFLHLECIITMASSKPISLSRDTFDSLFVDLWNSHLYMQDNILYALFNSIRSKQTIKSVYLKYIAHGLLILDIHYCLKRFSIRSILISFEYKAMFKITALRLCSYHSYSYTFFKFFKLASIKFKILTFQFCRLNQFYTRYFTSLYRPSNYFV